VNRDSEIERRDGLGGCYRRVSRRGALFTAMNPLGHTMDGVRYEVN